jgi:hypothetical protein
MAIFSKLILGSAILSSLALAAPFGEKPTFTVWETDYTTMDFTTTIYIDDARTKFGGFNGPFAHSTAASESIGTVAPLETSSPSIVSIAPAPAEASSEPAPTVAIPNPATETPVNPNPSSSTTPVAVTPAAVIPTTPSIPSAAPAPSTSAAMAGAVDTGSGSGALSSASDSATCEGEGTACQGDITYYNGGLGACGTNVDPTGNGIALPFAFMGAQSNGNPYCYRTLTIYNPATGLSAQAEVMDKCEGCDGRSIDLTPALFSSLTNDDLGLGRVHDVDWWFN